VSRAPKIAKAKGRSVTEWVGENPDSMPPASVRLRILRRFNNKCALTGIIIADGQTFDLDHIKRLEDGGANVESNLQPVLRLPHEIKSAAERKNAAKADRIAKKAHGLVAAKQKIQSAGFPKVDKAPKIDKRGLPPLPRRSIYTEC
jgi:5-methylcytosine-specific restriction enzyme A